MVDEVGDELWVKMRMEGSVFTLPHSSSPLHPHSSLPHPLTPSLPHPSLLTSSPLTLTSSSPHPLTSSPLTPHFLTPHPHFLPHPLTSSFSHSLTPPLPHPLTVKCLKCHETSDTYDPLLDLSLDIKNAVSILVALRRFVQPDVLDEENKYLCPQ